VRPVAPAPAARVAAGTPLPVPEEAVTFESTIASQDQLRTADPGLVEGAGPGTVEIAAPVETLPKIDDPVYVEEMPAVVHQVLPEYSEIARAAGVGGLVLVRVLVGRDGHVLDARVEPARSIPMLDEYALRAARQWVFKPALLNNRPVAVWVALPFRFTLR
jgi:protein TonB